jgi:hypothetical protein
VVGSSSATPAPHRPAAAAVHADDPAYRDFSDISELPPHRLAEIKRSGFVHMCLQGGIAHCCTCMAAGPRQCLLVAHINPPALPDFLLLCSPLPLPPFLWCRFFMDYKSNEKKEVVVGKLGSRAPALPNSRQLSPLAAAARTPRCRPAPLEPLPATHSPSTMLLCRGLPGSARCQACDPRGHGHVHRPVCAQAPAPELSGAAASVQQQRWASG